MKATNTDQIIALSTAFKALVVSLARTGRLDIGDFEEEMARGVAWLDRAGAESASVELRDEFVGLHDVLRELSQLDRK